MYRLTARRWLPMRSGMVTSTRFLSARSLVSNISLWITVFCLLRKRFMRRRDWKCKYDQHTPNRLEMFERPNNEIHVKFEDYRCVFAIRQAHKEKEEASFSMLFEEGISMHCIISLNLDSLHHFESTNTITQSTFIPYNARATTSTRPASRYFYTSLQASIPTKTQSNSAVVASFALAPSPHTRRLSVSASIPQSLLQVSQ